jgi:hypothetical protein
MKNQYQSLSDFQKTKWESGAKKIRLPETGKRICWFLYQLCAYNGQLI